MLLAKGKEHDLCPAWLSALFQRRSNPELSRLAEWTESTRRPKPGDAFRFFTRIARARSPSPASRRKVPPFYWAPPAGKVSTFRLHRCHGRDCQASLCPGNPLIDAEEQKARERGEDRFASLLLPQMLMRLRQGTGRLIRRGSDRGVIAILEPRWSTRSYRKQMLESLPPAPPSIPSRSCGTFATSLDATSFPHRGAGAFRWTPVPRCGRPERF